MKASVTLVLSILIWWISPTGGVAQQNQAIEFIRLRQDPHELARLEVTDILQDRFGFLWFATTKGLVRYDGHELRNYRENPLDPNSLGDNFIRTLEEDPNGNLWIGTGQGELFRYDPRQDHFMPITRDSSTGLSREIRQMLFDREKGLWLATKYGLEIVTPDLRRRQAYSGKGHPLNNYQINTLAKDALGRMWLGTAGAGLQLLDPSTGEVRKVDDSVLPGASSIHTVIIRMTQTADGKIWLSDKFPRLHCLDLIEKRVISYTVPDVERRASVQIWNISEDQHGNLWLGTQGDGLIHFAPSTGTYTHYLHDPVSPGSIASNSIGALLPTSDLLWVGYNGQGVDQLHTRQSGVYPLPFRWTADPPSVSRIVEDRQGTLWAATRGAGLYRLDPKTGRTTHFLHAPGSSGGLSHNLIWDLMVDDQGALWIATHNGLQRRDPEEGTWTTFTEASGFRHNAIRSLCQDERGLLWVGTFDGLHALDPSSNQIRVIEEPFENSHFIVLNLFEDSQNYLWVSAFGQGVFRINTATGKGIHFQNSQKDIHSLSSNLVISFAEDHQDRLWLGTQGGGLNLFVPHPSAIDSSSFQHWRNYNSNLSDENIWNIYTGADHRLWLSTDAGLFAFDTKEYRAVSYQLPGISRRFGIDPNLATPGMAYLWDSKWIYRFIPDSIGRNEKAPPVLLTGLSVNGRKAAPKNGIITGPNQDHFLEQSPLFIKELSLAHRQNNLTFEFSALNFIQPEKNRYRFKLEGYDEDWIETDAQNRRIRYTNLAPGGYRFQVIASNNDGIWNETGKTLTIRIAPPWWRTGWAYLGYTLLTFFLIRTLYVFQLRRRLAQAEAARLQELDSAKTRLYTNVTHEFRTPLTVILGMTQQVKDDPKEWFSEGMDAILRNGKQVLHLVNQMLDLSRLETGHLPVRYQQADIIPYLGYLVQSFQSYAASRQVDLQFSKEVKTLSMDFDPDLLSKAVNNLLSNAVKFTPENGQVTAVVKARGEQLEISIEDSGVGIPAEHLPHIFDRFYQADNSSVREGEGTGIGLALVKEIMDKMGGAIQVSSEPGVGTCFTITLPVRREAPLMATPALPETPVVNPMGPAVSYNGNGAGEAPTVLIIEDNVDVARYTASCLQDRYTVQLAADGRAGLEKAIETVPDLIICDVMMPELDGYEVCRRLKNDERTSHIPVVMLTAKADTDSRLEGLRRGADAYLAKPFNRQELELRLDNLLALRKKIQQHFAAFPESSQADDPGLRQEDAFLQKLKTAVLSRIGDEAFGIPELCRELATSRAQLHRKLKALTGRSASHVVRSIRLQRAKELLLSSDRNVSEIAYQTGFKNPSHFTAVFAEEFGQTPTEMREKRD